MTSGIQPGDTFETAMLSPCVGGLVRTWTDSGSRLWGVADPGGLASMMGQGLIARTPYEEGRFREVALLHEGTGTLLIQSRKGAATPDGGVQLEARELQLTEPGAPTSSVGSDLQGLLERAVRYTVAVDGFLLLETGGWDAPPEPYCLFLVVHEKGEMSVVETAPAPIGARFWAESIEPDAPGATMSAPISDETLAVVPTLIIDACATWGLEPWDLALTYGTRS